MTIYRKNKKKEHREKVVDDGEIDLLLKAGYIPVSDRISMVEENLAVWLVLMGCLEHKRPLWRL